MNSKGLRIAKILIFISQTLQEMGIKNVILLNPFCRYQTSFASWTFFRFVCQNCSRNEGLIHSITVIGRIRFSQNDLKTRGKEKFCFWPYDNDNTFTSSWAYGISKRLIFVRTTRNYHFFLTTPLNRFQDKRMDREDGGGDFNLFGILSGLTGLGGGGSSHRPRRRPTRKQNPLSGWCPSTIYICQMSSGRTDGDGFYPDVLLLIHPLPQKWST